MVEQLKKWLNNIFNKKPIIKENTFLIWEPCSKSHSEVIPGFAKYLLDLGFNVSVLTTPQNIKDGLFSRFQHENLFLNYLSQRQIKKFFLKNNLSNVAGVLVTTVGKLRSSTSYDYVFDCFNKNVDKEKFYFVEHEIKPFVDNGNWNKKLITLRQMNYKEAKSVVVNPHYFGHINITDKNENITNFITIGALNNKRKDCKMLIDGVNDLQQKGFDNFKITVVGDGKLKDIPKHLRKYFDIKGRLPFDKMYDEIEKADFLLTAYDKDNPAHKRYNTTGTSGNFQLVYGFLKPIIMVKDFASINGFDDENAILYDTNEDYANAMIKAINLSKEDYQIMQNNLKIYADNLYQESLNNLKELIDG